VNAEAAEAKALDRETNDEREAREEQEDRLAMCDVEPKRRQDRIAAHGVPYYVVEGDYEIFKTMSRRYTHASIIQKTVEEFDPASGRDKTSGTATSSWRSCGGPPAELN
jgi:hypothetical protein